MNFSSSGKRKELNAIYLSGLFSVHFQYFRQRSFRSIVNTESLRKLHNWNLPQNMGTVHFLPDVGVGGGGEEAGRIGWERNLSCAIPAVDKTWNSILKQELIRAHS